MTRASLGELLCFLHAAAAQATDSLLRFPVRSESCPCDLHTQSIGGNKTPANLVGQNQHLWCIYVIWGDMRRQRKLQERRGTQILTDASAVLQVLAGGGWPLPDARQGGLQPVQHAATHRPCPALYCESSPYISAPVKSALSCACMHSLQYMAQWLVYKIRMLMCGVHTSSLKPLNCPRMAQWD